MNILPGQNTCPSNNICVVTAGENAPACGAVAAHMAPLLTAEQCCIRALNGAYTTTAREAYPDDRILHTAWAKLDLGRAARDEKQAAAHFMAAENAATHIKGSSTYGLAQQIDAATLDAYLPAFRALRTGRPLMEHGLSTLRASLVEMYDFAHTTADRDELPDSIAPGDAIRAGLRARLAVALLALRYGKILYPASPRERVNNYPLDRDDRTAGERKQLKHDFYDIGNPQDIKVPIKVNTKKRTGYGLTVMGVSIRGLVRSAVERVTASGNPEAQRHMGTLLNTYGSPADLAARLPAWVAAETRGHPQPQPHELLLVDCTTDVLRAKIEQRRKELTGDTPPAPGAHHYSNYNAAVRGRLIAAGLLED